MLRILSCIYWFEEVFESDCYVDCLIEPIYCFPCFSACFLGLSFFSSFFSAFSSLFFYFSSCYMLDLLTFSFLLPLPFSIACKSSIILPYDDELSSALVICCLRASVFLLFETGITSSDSSSKFEKKLSWLSSSFGFFTIRVRLPRTISSGSSCGGFFYAFWLS